MNVSIPDRLSVDSTGLLNKLDTHFLANLTWSPHAEQTVGQPGRQIR
jgi:hypothetical protein